MMIFLSAFVASLDGFIIGLGLKLSHKHFSKRNAFFFFVGNIIIYSTVLFVYTFFHFQFVTKFISTLLYLFLAYNAWKENVDISTNNSPESISFLQCILLVLTHSIDGTLVSLGFVYEYPIWFLVLLFSLMSISILLFGYFFAHLFRTNKKSNWIGALLFVLLAILNQFF